MDVFDWKEDEIAGHTDAEFCRKFLTNNNNNDARKGAEGKSEMKGFTNLTLNVDTINNHDDNGDSAALTALVDGEDCAAKRTSVIDDILQNGSDVGGKFLQFGQDEVETRSSCSQMERSSSPEAASPATQKFSCSQLDSSPSDESIDADESWSEISESTSSDSAEDDVSLDGRSADLCFGNCKMVDPDSVIECRPDYIEFRDKSLTDSVITFSASCIKIKSSIACGEYGTFVFQWGIVDVIKIESHWRERLKLAEVKIHIIKGAVPNEDTNGSSVIEELKFAIGDDWYEKQDAIRSLDVYKPLWYTVQDDIDVAALLKSDANALLEQDGVLFKSYFPSFNEAFEDVIYPKGDPDAVSISKRDVDLLQPDTFVNDTIIDFYIKYLKIKIEPGERHRFHFFNSFFFRKLADLDKNPSSALEGRAAFQRVRKWTRKIDMFEKDYVFIPVNFNYHWSLIVICYPGDVAVFRDACPVKSPKVPCILHMDSIRGSHSGLKGLLQSYLCEEWKERQKDTPEDISSRFLNLRFVSLELPQQQNSYDCGLFLLHYVELFLKDIPLTFNPLKITKSDKFLTVDWFQPSEASLKRTAIEKLIHELLESSCEDSTDVGSDKIKNCSSNCPKSLDESGYNIEFLSGTRSPTQALYGNLPISQAGNGIELTLLPTPSMKSFQCASDSGLVLKQFLNPVASVGSFYQDFEQAGPFDAYENAMPQTQGEQESSMQFEYSPSAENILEQLSTEFGGQPSWSPGSTVKQKEQDIVDPLPEASIYDDSLEVKEVNDSTVGINLSLEVKVEQPRSPLTDNIEGLRDCLGPVSSEFLNPNTRNNLDQMFDGTENAEPLTPCPKDLLGSSPQQSDTQENGNETCEVELTYHDDSVSESDVEHAIKRRLDIEENGNETCEGEQTFHDNPVSESDVEHATKKRRVTPPEDEGEPTKSLGVELHL